MIGVGLCCWGCVALPQFSLLLFQNCNFFCFVSFLFISYSNFYSVQQTLFFYQFHIFCCFGHFDHSIYWATSFMNNVASAIIWCTVYVHIIISSFIFTSYVFFFLFLLFLTFSHFYFLILQLSSLLSLILTFLLHIYLIHILLYLPQLFFFLIFLILSPNF